jgi:hypothetical protein
MMRDVNQAVTLADAFVPGWRESDDPALFGHYFWLTRNGHGVSYLDSDFGDDSLREKLCAIATSFPSVELYVGDDLKIYSI